jgi:hypothetical protein
LKRRLEARYAAKARGKAMREIFFLPWCFRIYGGEKGRVN